MENTTEYCQGDHVLLRAPADETEEMEFCTGWKEDDMRAWDNKIGRVLKKDPGIGYLVCLEENYDEDADDYEDLIAWLNFDDYWWWDPKFMSLATQTKEVSNEEYVNVLFEG